MPAGAQLGHPPRADTFAVAPAVARDPAPLTLDVEAREYVLTGCGELVATEDGALARETSLSDPRAVVIADRLRRPARWSGSSSSGESGPSVR